MLQSPKPHRHSLRRSAQYSTRVASPCQFVGEPCQSVERLSTGAAEPAARWREPYLLFFSKRILISLLYIVFPFSFFFFFPVLIIYHWGFPDTSISVLVPEPKRCSFSLFFLFIFPLESILSFRRNPQSTETREHERKEVFGMSRGTSCNCTTAIDVYSVTIPIFAAGMYITDRVPFSPSFPSFFLNSYSSGDSRGAPAGERVLLRGKKKWTVLFGWLKSSQRSCPAGQLGTSTWYDRERSGGRYKKLD